MENGNTQLNFDGFEVRSKKDKSVYIPPMVYDKELNQINRYTCEDIESCSDLSDSSRTLRIRDMHGTPVFELYYDDFICETIVDYIEQRYKVTLSKEKYVRKEIPYDLSDINTMVTEYR